MIELPAYPLALAASAIGCTETALIHLAACADMMANPADRLYLYGQFTGKRANRVYADPDYAPKNNLPILVDMCRLPSMTLANYNPARLLTHVLLSSDESPGVFYELVDAVTLGDVALLVLSKDVKRLLEANKRG